VSLLQPAGSVVQEADVSALKAVSPSLGRRVRGGRCGPGSWRAGGNRALRHPGRPGGRRGGPVRQRPCPARPVQGPLRYGLRGKR